MSLIFTSTLGFGNVILFLGVSNYLIDSYTIYAASVLAANAVLRSLFGAGFPLFTTAMYQKLGIHWASSIPAFLALVCVPLPFLFYRYGAAIRQRCQYSAEAARVMEQLRKSHTAAAPASSHQPAAELQDSKPEEKANHEV